MKVIKIGGGCLKGRKNIARILDLIAERGIGNVVVVSALNGVTDDLIQGSRDALENEEKIPEIVAGLRKKHMRVARHVFQRESAVNPYARELDRMLREIERFYYGLNFTREITRRMLDMISSYGERFSAGLLTAALRSRHVEADCLMPHRIGMLTDGKYGDATADLRRTSKNLETHLLPLTGKKGVLFVPGFYGVSERGDITTFGRGGSDYSAAVLAAALKADVLEVWKDVAGYMSADPRLVRGARLIPSLSYDEAAELSYFGAKILHPRTVEPLRRARLQIVIKNTLNPDGPGSLIAPGKRKSSRIIKSVAHDTDIGILKVHASGVGARPGILGLVANRLTESGINIKSVVTSQTVISILLARGDVEDGRLALKELRPRPYRKLEKTGDVALVSLVGEGLGTGKGIAARCFTAVAERGVNVEMISFGPSRVALYFIVRTRDLRDAVCAIHEIFFPRE
ncbi:MAG: aspartate kinase [Deltaproteobacteria bacterium]|nr:aspartate kinase [Deltaproteobacteria bacterium]